MFSWKKMGLVFNPMESKPRPWMQEFAQCPTPLVLNEKIIRVYITTRGPKDDGNRYVSVPAYVDLDRNDLTRIVGIAEKPIMEMGGKGAFDEHGITPTSFVRTGEGLYVFYTGWSRMQEVPYSMSIGVALSRDGGYSFEKLHDGPLMASTSDEHHLLSGPIVKVIGGKWHMWYLSGKKWLENDGKREPVYQLAHARSRDGIAWERNGRPIITPREENESQVSFAVFSDAGRWHSFFAYRQHDGFRKVSERSYRLGYAWSTDLDTWVRDDGAAGITVSKTGWDSWMMCYPQVLEDRGRLYLFYCGNGFGRNGFGVAEAVEGYVGTP